MRTLLLTFGILVVLLLSYLGYRAFSPGQPVVREQSRIAKSSEIAAEQLVMMKYNQQLYNDKAGVTCTEVRLIEQTSNTWTGTAVLSNGVSQKIAARLEVGGITFEILPP